MDLVVNNAKRLSCQRDSIEGYEFKARKSNTTRYEVIYGDDDCNWKIISSKCKGSSKWELGTVNDHYTCLKTQIDGTVTHIKTDDEDRFKMVFIAFGVVIRSFKYHMRPLIIIDATHLKGSYLGTNLLTIGIDGNNQIIPIATGVSQGETGPSWTRFLSKLKECIGEIPNLTIISDRHAAILSSCEVVFPNAFHG
ncbi:transposase, MuDR, MULE transposase domain protein [Tanacetum coccineum]